MKFGVFLGVLSMVIGTFGFAVETLNTSRATTDNDVTSTVKTAIKIQDMITSGENKNKFDNHSDDIAHKTLLSNRSSNGSEKFTIPSANENNNSITENEPKNIIVVLVEGVDSEKSWKKLKENHSFAVEGFLKSCKLHKSNDTNTTATTDDDDSNCECSRALKSNISDLMTYARLDKGMNVATVSDDISDAVASPVILEIHPQLITKSHSLHHEKERVLPKQFSKLNSIAPIFTTPDSLINHHKNDSSDKIWNLFDTLARIRLDFLQNIFNSMLQRPNIDRNIKKNSRRSSLVSSIEQSPTFNEIISDTLRDIQTTSNDNKGFFMIIVTPHNKLSEIYEITQSQLKNKNNLIIISGLDTTHEQLIPYVANGPGSNYFNNLQTIHELPLKIKFILDLCRICNNDVLPTSRMLLEEISVPKIRVARSANNESVQEPVGEPKSGTVDETNEDDTGHDVSHNIDGYSYERGGSSANLFLSQRNFITLSLSIVSSFIAVLISHT